MQTHKQNVIGMQIQINAKSLKCPVLVHDMTKKGKGYLPAQQSPELYHGVSSFDPAVGDIDANKSDFSSEFGQALTSLAAKDARICAVTAAMPSGTGLSEFAETYPQRLFDVGIAEEHAVAMVAGMTKQGLKPVCAMYSTFLQRGYDQLIHDVAIEGIPALFCVDRAGIVGADGATHNGTFDIPFLRSIPGLDILCPASYAELRAMLIRAIYHAGGPTVIRYPRGAEGQYQEENSTQPFHVLENWGENPQVTLVTYGVLLNECCKAATLLDKQGIAVRVLKINEIGMRLWDEFSKISRLLTQQYVVVIEDCVQEGCFGQALAMQILHRRDRKSVV